MPDNIFPWQQWMAFGFGTLKLPPEHFWALTPKELNAALTGIYGPPSLSQPPARRDLSSLMQQYPDKHT